MREEKKVKKTTIRIDEKLHKKLQHYVIDNNTSIQELTIELYKSLLDEK